MGWRHLSSLAVGGCPATRTTAAAALMSASRAAHPPRPPAWAAGAVQKSRQAAATRHPNTSSAASAQPVNSPVPHIAGSTASRAAAFTDASSSSRGTATSDGTHRQPVGASTTAFASSSNAAPTPCASTAAGAPRMRSRVEAFDSTATPPPNSYAYVHSKSNSNTGAGAPHGKAQTAPSPTSTTASAKQQTLVSVEGETQPIAAAPGAVRRALQHGKLSSTDGDAFSPSPSSAAAATAQSAALHRLEHLLMPSEALAQQGGHADAVSPPSTTGPLSAAERHVRRERRRRTRELRDGRRQARAEQSGGGASSHPCRIQGGFRQHAHGETLNTVARASSPGFCPYRSFPAEYCVTQLRDGHCALHDIGCCPWMHGDLSESAGRGENSSSFASPSALAPSGESSAEASSFHLISPFSSQADSAENVAVVQRSAERVGRLLQLCVDAVVAAAEEEGIDNERNGAQMAGSATLRSALVSATPSLSLQWRALQETLHGCETNASDAHFLSVECVGRAHAADSHTEALPVLSVPADLAWCAMATVDENENPQEHVDTSYEDEVLGLSATPTAVDAPPLEPAPMSSSECAYWSSFFTYEASTTTAKPSPENQRSADNTTERSVGPRLRLTPCVSAWVLETAALQLQATSDEHRAQSEAYPSQSARWCFQAAAMYLLGFRREELAQYMRGETSSVPASPIFSASRRECNGLPTSEFARVTGVSTKQWAPVLLLRDLLMAASIPALNDSSEATSHLEHLADLTDGEGAERTSPHLDSLTAGTRATTLLHLFLTASSRPPHTPVKDGAATDALVLRGGRLARHFAQRNANLANTALTQSTADMRDAGEAFGDASSSARRSDSTRSAAAAQAEFEDAWAAVHELVLSLQWGLLTDPRSTSLSRPSEHTVVFSPPHFPAALPPAAMSLALFLQPAMLQLTSGLSAAFAHHYEASLRSLVGWQPWTDQQLFGKEHAAVYNAATYARHHLPVVRLGLHNSLLNSLLLLSTRRADDAFSLGEPSDVRQILLSGPTQRSDDAGAADEWWASVQQCEHRFRQQHLQPFASHSMGLLTALQELSREHLTLRQSLMRAYEQRRAASEFDLDSGSSTRNLEHKRKAGEELETGGTASRTRKYNRPSAQQQLASQRQRLEELRGVPLLDRLLPTGSATVSPDAAAALLRQLLEGGHPYKALKLAASIVHASRMLRHADKQPRPTLQEGFRTVHRRVWSSKTQRHVLVKQRVPVLRLIGDEERDGVDGSSSRGDGDGRPRAQTRRTVQPVGLVFALSPRVVEEIARVGLRMGDSGAALVDGVVQDCVRGALLDFTAGRGLPAPSWSDVERVLAHAATARAGGGAGGHERAQTAVQRARRPGRSASRGDGVVGALVRLMGTGDVSSTSLLQRSSGNRATWQEEEGFGAPHRRTAPTPLLLEILQGHTAPSDTTRHTACLRVLLQDVPLFSTWPVLFALQYQACDKKSRYGTARTYGVQSAARAMQAVYVLAVLALGRSASSLTSSSSSLHLTASVPPDSRASVNSTLQRLESGDGLRAHQQLVHEAEAFAAQVQEWIASDPSSVLLLGSRGASGNTFATSPSAGSLRVKDVKAMLSGDITTREENSSQGGGEDAGEEEGSMTRRAKLQLPVLLHHVWTSTVQHRSAPQQCATLWAVCTATLLGTSRTALLPARQGGKPAAEADLVALALHHSYVAAGIFMRQHASPPQAMTFVEATVKALLFSAALEEAGEGTRAGGDVGLKRPPPHSSSANYAGEWPMRLSSARTPVVQALHSFLTLQRALLTAVMENEEKDESSPSTFPLAEARTLLSAWESEHAALPDNIFESPVWLLFQPLRQQHALAQWWLLDTFLFPPSSLLVWIVGAVGRTDVVGYAHLRTWLLHIPRGSHLSEETRQRLLREVERRQRGAAARQRHQR